MKTPSYEIETKFASLQSSLLREKCVLQVQTSSKLLIIRSIYSFSRELQNGPGFFIVGLLLARKRNRGINSKPAGFF
jgi:hypothetical protein